MMIKIPARYWFHINRSSSRIKMTPFCSSNTAINMSNECKPNLEMDDTTKDKSETKEASNLVSTSEASSTTGKVRNGNHLKRLQYYEGPNRHSHKQLFKSDFDVNKFARETHSQRPKRLLKEVIRYEPTTLPDRKIKKLKHADNLAVGEGFQCPRCGSCCFYDDTECGNCLLRCRYMAGTGVVVLKERNDMPVKGQKKDWFISKSLSNETKEKKVKVAN